MATLPTQYDNLHQVVRLGLRAYGEEGQHRFGMSDDDPSNLRLIRQAMQELKLQRPRCAFFVIDASREPLTRVEITGLSDAVVSRSPREG